MRKIHEETTTQVLERKCGRRARTRGHTLTLAYSTQLHFIMRCSNNYFFVCSIKLGGWTNDLIVKRFVQHPWCWGPVLKLIWTRVWHELRKKGPAWFSIKYVWPVSNIFRNVTMVNSVKKCKKWGILVILYSWFPMVENKLSWSVTN